MEVQKNQTMETMLVKNIRESQAKITTKPIVYYWWFKKAAIVKLFSFTQLDLGKLKFKIFEGDSYVLLYVGKGKNGHARLVDYHILDNNNFHRLKTVLNGRLSSLRQTLCGLLKIQMSKGKQEINDFMDENCLVEWKCVSEENLKTT
ncbi:MAG: hypothetical protein H8D62_03015, partial [Bacteroidetes bacterium]|nr:hypothetical protein [Bacteroidota bacterium]